MPHSPTALTLSDRYRSAPAGVRSAFLLLAATGAAWVFAQAAGAGAWWELLLHAVVGYLGFDCGVALLRRKRLGFFAGALLAVALMSASAVALASGAGNPGHVAVVLAGIAATLSLLTPGSRAWFSDADRVMSPILRNPHRGRR